VAAHVRIRILLVLAAAVIGGGVFVVTEVQRRSAETSFEKYAAVRELRRDASELRHAAGAVGLTLARPR